MTQSNPSLICNFVSIVKMNRNKDRRTGVINRRKTYSFNTKHKNIPESLYRNIKIRSAWGKRHYFCRKLYSCNLPWVQILLGGQYIMNLQNYYLWLIIHLQDINICNYLSKYWSKDTKYGRQIQFEFFFKLKIRALQRKNYRAFPKQAW